MHFGQGKWYPGEQLPRWALGCYWRRDGEPAWSDPSLFADENAAGGHGSADAARFIQALAVRLGVAATHVQAGYEDVWYYLWRERRLPVNVDPFDARLEDEMERDRLRRVFSQGLDQIVGYALPLERDDADGALADRRRGSCERAACTSSRATRRWAIACRSTRFPGRARATIPR